MPELPEVETIVRGLQTVLPGRCIEVFDVRLKKMFIHDGPEGKTRIIGARVIKVERRGKVILLRLSTGVTLLIHLKMTGQLIFRTKGQLKLAGGHPLPYVDGELPGKTTHAIFVFDDGSELFFNDLRQFGYLKLVPDEDVMAVPIMAKFGPEPLADDFTAADFSKRINKRPNAKLKPLLLDQTFIAGLGNIYVDEALNLAKLHPLKRAGSLTSVQRKVLFSAIRTVLLRSLELGGTSDNSYVSIRGEKGDYLKNARVYHRTGEPCLRCGTPIQRLVVAGRGTHICPVCQVKPRARRAL